MNYRNICLVACFLGSFFSVCSEPERPQQKSSDTLTIAKVLAGTGCSAGFLYALRKWVEDTQILPKRNANSSSYFSFENRYRLTSDAFTSLGLLYLTYLSGLFTINELNELLSTDEPQNK